MPGARRKTTKDAATKDAADAARSYAALFPAVYLRFHRRDGKRSELSGASRAVLLHLAQTGPMTVGECARHLGRAQSVMSEIVDQLEKNGLLARVRDEADRRRALVWLTDDGRARLTDEQEVLGHELLARAMAAMTPDERARLIDGTRALVEAADRLAGDGPEDKRRKR
jgi:DNA-binding MarR family transcriptional regulator